MCPLTVDYSWGYTMLCKKHYSYTWTKSQIGRSKRYLTKDRSDMCYSDEWKLIVPKSLYYTKIDAQIDWPII